MEAAAPNHWNQERDFKPLFSGMAKTRCRGQAARAKSNTASPTKVPCILVPSGKLAETRLQLASAGLPKSSHIGMELFDKANLQASEFAEQVNYHRAIEGELERSVMSLREVEQAFRITLAKDSLYSRQRQPAKASVGEAAPHRGVVAAECRDHLSVDRQRRPGYRPSRSRWSIPARNLLNRPHASGDGEDEHSSEAALEYRKSVEHDIQAKWPRPPQPLLGVDHFRTGVSADVDITSADQSDEIFDPQESVIATSQTTQDGPGLPSASGIPGTPSNLPNPTSQPVTNLGASNYARHTESVTYSTSRVVKHTKLPQGSLKRLSLAVLVDHSVRFEGARRVIEPPSTEKLKVIRDRYPAATGLYKRGEQLVVDAFPFESTLAAEPLALAAPRRCGSSALPAWLQNLMEHKNFALIAALGGAGIMALIVGWVVLVMRRRKKRMELEMAKSLEAAKAKELPGSRPTPEQSLEAQMAEQAVEKAKQEAEALMKLKLPVISTRKPTLATKHIAAEIKDPTVMARIGKELAAWRQHPAIAISFPACAKPRSCW